LEKGSNKDKENKENVKQNLDFMNDVFLKNSYALNPNGVLDKKFRPKCDLCAKICEFEWYVNKAKSKSNVSLVCVSCYEVKLNKESQVNYELANFFNIINQNDDFHNILKEKTDNENWTKEQKMKLVEAIEKHGENWEEILNVFGGKKTKQDCILQFLQMPIKESVNHNLFNSKPKGNGPVSEDDPIVSQVMFFAKMFEKFTSDELTQNEVKNTDFTETENLKEVIYKTYAKSIDHAKSLQKKEKKKMRKIMDLLIYLQMKKIELKLSYFNDFDKLVQFNKQQIKTMESQFISDRINLALNKIEITNHSNKLKENLKHYSEFNDVCQNLSNSEKFKTDNDIKILELK
jgi:SWI/SNF related-matrix-associated actin-dependent regulator of chromatin subfamily C